MTEGIDTKNVFVGRNPTTQRPYFERRRVSAPDPENPENVPTFDQLPPTDEPVDPLASSYTAGEDAERMEREADLTEAAIRQARGLPPEGSSDESTSGA